MMVLCATTNEEGALEDVKAWIEREGYTSEQVKIMRSEDVIKVVKRGD